MNDPLNRATVLTDQLFQLSGCWADGAQRSLLAADVKAALIVRLRELDWHSRQVRQVVSEDNPRTPWRSTMGYLAAITLAAEEYAAVAAHLASQIEIGLFDPSAAYNCARCILLCEVALQLAKKRLEYSPQIIGPSE